jgi:hypothetical protein
MIYQAIPHHKILAPPILERKLINLKIDETFESKHDNFHFQISKTNTSRKSVNHIDILQISIKQMSPL